MSPVATVYDAMGDRPVAPTDEAQVGLFDDKQLPVEAQLGAIDKALAALNALVGMQFQLHHRALQCAVNAQAELYRARHAHAYDRAVDRRRTALQRIPR